MRTNGLYCHRRKNILIAPDSPQNMTLNGIFVAQNGAFDAIITLTLRGVDDGTYEPRGTLTILEQPYLILAIAPAPGAEKRLRHGLQRRVSNP